VIAALPTFHLLANSSTMEKPLSMQLVLEKVSRSLGGRRSSETVRQSSSPSAVVQREMECGRFPLVSMARASAGRLAAERNGEWHEEVAEGNWTN
jgi:hypothetical protein